MDNSGSSTISVFNGTKVIANVSVGNEPGPAVVDASNHYVYVPNYVTKNLSVINGTAVNRFSEGGD